MSGIEGRWRLERVSGLLPPLGPVVKDIAGGRGGTRVGPLPGIPFRVEGDGGGAALRYRRPFGALVDRVTPRGDGLMEGEATIGGRTYGRFRMLPGGAPTPPVRRASRVEARLPAWLDTVGERMQGLLGRTLRGRLGDALNGVWLGHPLHPVLTDIPSGAWTAASAMDAAGRHRAAAAATLVGVAGGVGAALSGAADWARAGATARRTALVHASANGAALVLMAASLAAPAHNARRLRLGGYALASAAAWLGGELVYGHGLGVDANARRSAPEGWTEVARLEELEAGTPARREAGGAAVVLVREGDEVRVGWGTCSHLGGPLEADGEGRLRCPWHGSAFRMADGGVEHGPATAALPCVEARVVDGRVEVRGA